MLDRKWKSQPIKLQELKTKPEIVVILEENGVLIARTTFDDLESTNLVAILGVDSSREGIRISQLYNKMIACGVKVISLNSIVNAINILGENNV